MHNLGFSTIDLEFPVLAPCGNLTVIHGKFLSPLQSLYDNVKCAVKVNDCLTPWLEVDTGVKQGCLLLTVSKALRMSMNDTSVDCLAIFLSLILFSGHPGISGNELSPLSFRKSKLQLMLNEVVAWCQDWKLQINRTKTKIMHSMNASVHQSPHMFCCGIHNLDYAN
jgi:hypothetical protein